MPAMTLSSDDLPVPLRPMRPTRSPSSIDERGAIEQRMQAERELGVLKREERHGRSVAQRSFASKQTKPDRYAGEVLPKHRSGRLAPTMDMSAIPVGPS